MRSVIIAVLLSIAFVSSSFAGYVRGYMKSDGTYVSGYYRSNSNSTVRDNYSYKDNSNPYTGEKGTNYYRKSRSSEYYEKSPSIFKSFNQK